MAKNRKQETLDYTALKRELKSKGPENLYMLWGPEDYLIADFVSSLRDICVSGEMRDFDAKRLNGPLPDARDVEDALNAMPFFGGRTFVELSGFDVNRCKDDKLPALLSDIPGGRFSRRTAFSGKTDQKERKGGGIHRPGTPHAVSLDPAQV